MYVCYQVRGSHRSTYGSPTRCVTWSSIVVRRSIGEMWSDLAIPHIVFELFMLNRDFPEIHTGKRVWSTRLRRRQRIEMRISWEAGDLLMRHVRKYVLVFRYTFLIWNWLIAREDIWRSFLHIYGVPSEACIHWRTAYANLRLWNLA